MRGKVFLVDWDLESAARRATALRRAGFAVEVESENGGRAYRTIRTSMPDAVVIDLRRRPSHRREVGSALRELRATRSVPILCIEDGVEAREVTRAKIADVRFASDADRDEALASTIADATRERLEAERRARRATARSRSSSTSSQPRR